MRRLVHCTLPPELVHQPILHDLVRATTAVVNVRRANVDVESGVAWFILELTGPEDPMRVQTATPEKSLVLTMPSAESPPDAHPNVTFTGPQDPDYQKILVWIREGAKQN